MQLSELALHRQVHCVILASIHELDPEVNQAILAPAELERNARFRCQQDRRLHLLAHTLKRVCLAVRSGLPPEAMVFSRGEHGKPQCQQPGVPFFNLSHGGEYVALALSERGDVGVDIEPCNRKMSTLLARRVMTPRQLEQLEKSPFPDRDLMLLWTQKEAVSKCLGPGYAMGFAGIECRAILERQELGRQELGKQELGRQVLPRSSSGLLSGLWLESHKMEDAYFLSVCSMVDSALPVYRINSW